MRNEIQLMHGDCLERLKELPDNSVDSVVTDPPYGLSFMGKKWDYDVPATEVWAECLRVLKHGGHLLAFAGTRTQHRMAVRIEDAGFEIRDMIAWVYGSGFPKSHNLKGEWQGWGTALKPALEPITVARKPLVGTVAENVLEHGTGAINVDGCRVGNETVKICNYKSTGAQGCITHTGVAGHSGREYEERSSQGRWPANLIHDGSDEVVGLFPQTGASKSTPRNNGEFKSVAKGRDLPHVTHGHDDNGGSAARFFYCAKASKADRDEGCEGMENVVAPYRQVNSEWKADARHPEGGYATAPQPKSRNHHPTVKPTALMRYLCRLVTPLGGIVLDPFMGSGSTGKAAILENFRFIGIEREAEYVEIAKARIEAAKTLI